MSSSTSSFVSPTSKRWMGKSTRDSLAKVSNTFLMIVSIYLANIFHSFSLSSSLLCYYIARIFTASFYQYILSCIWSWIDLHTWYWTIGTQDKCFRRYWLVLTSILYLHCGFQLSNDCNIDPWTKWMKETYDKMICNEIERRNRTSNEEEGMEEFWEEACDFLLKNISVEM